MPENKILSKNKKSIQPPSSIASISASASETDDEGGSTISQTQMDSRKACHPFDTKQQGDK